MSTLTGQRLPMISETSSSVKIRSLVGCFEDIRRLSSISVISRLGSRRKPISEIVVARSGIEPRASCSASQELNHYTTASPCHDSSVSLFLNASKLPVFRLIMFFFLHHPNTRRVITLRELFWCEVRNSTI